MKGPCWHCNGRYPIKRDGTLRRHRTVRGLEWMKEIVCPGSGQVPRERCTLTTEPRSAS